MGIFFIISISPVYAQICFLNAQHTSPPEGLGMSIVLFPIVGIVTFFVSYRLLGKFNFDSS